VNWREEKSKIWIALFFEVEYRGQKINYMHIIGELLKNFNTAADKGTNDATLCKRLKTRTKTKKE